MSSDINTWLAQNGAGELSYAAEYADVMSDPTTSRWLKIAAMRLEQRDPNDVLTDLATLTALTTLRVQEAVK